MSREPSIGELDENMRELKTDVKEVLRMIAAQTRDFEMRFVPRDLYEARHSNVLEKLAKMEQEKADQDARISRAVYTAITAVIVPLIMFFVTYYLTRGGS
jgi:uncharacterized membrane protein (DUF106 family)